jgi:hypothetical protein
MESRPDMDMQTGKDAALGKCAMAMAAGPAFVAAVDALVLRHTAQHAAAPALTLSAMQGA